MGSEEAGSEPYNNPPARSLKSARFVRSEEAGSEPYNNPPARSLKSTGFVRSEEAGSEPYNNPPARSVRLGRNEEPGSEPHSRSSRFLRSFLDQAVRISKSATADNVVYDC